MKLSTRLLQEFLAGKIERERFERGVSSDTNLFKTWLDMGYVIRSARVEDAGVDEDDDQLVLEFERDPAAVPFA